MPTSRAVPRRRLAVAAAVTSGALTLSGCAGVSVDADKPAASSTAFHGSEPVGGTPVRPQFRLRDTAGNSFDFRKATGGRPTLLYFGYTSCPDQCPTAMADIAAALRVSPAAVRERVQVVFATTDAARDDAKRVRQFLDQWSVDFQGLVGTQAELDAAQRAVGLSPAAEAAPVATVRGTPDEHVHAPGTAPHKHFGPLGYGVDHADVIFAFDTRDRMPVLYPGGIRPLDLAADLPLLDHGGPT